MVSEKVNVYIPIEEYRGLVRVQRDMECLQSVMQERLKAFGGISHEELDILCKMFLQPVKQEEEEEEDW